MNDLKKLLNSFLIYLFIYLLSKPVTMTKRMDYTLYPDENKLNL